MSLFRLLRSNSGLIFYISLMIVVASMPLSRFGLSVGQFALLGIWIIEGRFREKAKALFSDRAALVLISFYFMHVLGLLYTTDFQWAMKDLRVKLPLLWLPIVFVTSKPLSRERTNTLLLVYIAAVLVASLISLRIYLFEDFHDFRELSPLISHIRLSLNVCLAIFLTAQFGFSIHAQQRAMPVLAALLIAWLVMFLVMIESVTGLVILLVAAYVLAIAAFVRLRRKVFRIASGIFLVLMPLAVGLYLVTTVDAFLRPHKNDLSSLEPYTAMGNPYTHDTLLLPVENGSYVGLYCCEPELRAAWNERSTFDYDGNDEMGQELKQTLTRYLNSRGLRKDAQGVARLTESDIRHVEKGIANVHYTRPFSLNSRIYKLLWEYQVRRLQGNPGGHSIAQRLEYWRVSLDIIRHHLLLGVGTGDIRDAYALAYERLDSPLEMQYRHRAHNQYLAIFVTFGVVGLAWFVLSLVYPGIVTGKFRDYRYLVFWITLIMSMLVEDTLETQMGATLFAFFNAFLLFGTERDRSPGGGMNSHAREWK